jgi:hypothetical protein
MNNIRRDHDRVSYLSCLYIIIRAVHCLKHNPKAVIYYGREMKP